MALQWLTRGSTRGLWKAAVLRPWRGAHGLPSGGLRRPLVAASPECVTHGRLWRPNLALRRGGGGGAARSLSLEPLRIFNSLTNQVEPFVVGADSTTSNDSGTVAAAESPPFSDGTIRWYNCGPTVYDSAHLGHARTYVCLDIIRRVLARHFRLDVLYALGLTDVDDKIIRRAAESSPPVSPLALARRFETEFFQDLARLGVAPPDAVLRVTEHVPDIVDYIAELQAKGYAYVNDADASVYFDVAAFNSAESHRYGTMGPAAAGALRGADVDLPNADEGDEGGLDRGLKRDPRDFVLWKAAKPDREPVSVQWPSPWGPGRPGWHIECSVMSRAACGDHLDLHSGGVDLKFPHHCNEVAQSEAFNGPSAPAAAQPSCCGAGAADGAHHLLHNTPSDHGGGKANAPWSRFFLHTGHLFIEGLKMSKSLKNFISVRDLLDGGGGGGPGPRGRGFSPDAFRMFCLQYSYRSSVHYSPDRMEEANALLRRFQNFLGISGVHVAQATAAANAAAAAAASANANATTTQAAPAASSDDEAPTPPAFPTAKRWRAEEVRLRGALARCRADVHAALADDLDTPRALQALQQLTQDAYEYTRVWDSQAAAAAAAAPATVRGEVGGGDIMPAELLQAVRGYVSETFELFGFSSLDLGEPIGGGCDSRTAGATGEGLASSSSLAAAGARGAAADLNGAQVLLEFRAAVRGLALASSSAGSSASGGSGGGVDRARVFELCDALRDHVLPLVAPDQLAVDLASAQAGLETAWSARLASSKAASADTSMDSSTANTTRTRAAAQLASYEAVMQVPPEAFFRTLEGDAFSAFREDGVPTHDANGEPLSKSRLKKLQKRLDKHRRAFDKFHSRAAAAAAAEAAVRGDDGRTE